MGKTNLSRDTDPKPVSSYDTRGLVLDDEQENIFVCHICRAVILIEVLDTEGPFKAARYCPFCGGLDVLATHDFLAILGPKRFEVLQGGK